MRPLHWLLHSAVTHLQVVEKRQREVTALQELDMDEATTEEEKAYVARWNEFLQFTNECLKPSTPLASPRCCRENSASSRQDPQTLPAQAADARPSTPTRMLVGKESPSNEVAASVAAASGEDPAPMNETSDGPRPLRRLSLQDSQDSQGSQGSQGLQGSQGSHKPLGSQCESPKLARIAPATRIAI